MALTAGTRLGPYEVVAAIGAGGMGEVWRARDTKLGRDVALKILPEQFATDPDRLARFKREAQVLASLNHPNIGGIYGLEESNGVQALVLELVDGPTLADRIAQGVIPLDEALPIAKQIAEALEAAHEQGIIHRDLKPANIKLRSDGTVKVLDFGLAKGLEPRSAGDVNATTSPTITSPAMTSMGVILGTAAYMSPEQAKGREADRRSDVWAFGAVLYEMLTGKRAFEGEDVSETLAFVLTRQPEWGALPAATPPTIRKLLRRCLEKDRKRRLADAADARIEIEEAAIAGEVAIQAPPASRRRERVLWLLALAVSTGAAIAGLIVALRPGPAPPELRLELTTPPTPDQASVAVSPDGRNVVFAAPSDGRPVLWLRSLETGTARPLTGTDNGTLPFWSPDSRSVAFSADSKLKRIDIDGGAIQTLTTLPGRLTTGAWSKEGTILFSLLGQPLYRIAAEGGQPVALAKLVREGGVFLPHFLPDGRHFLYYLSSRPEVRGVYVGNIEDGATGPRLLDADTAAVYVSGHVLFGRHTALFAQRFDPNTLTLGGAPFAVAENVRFPSIISGLSASDDGTIVFRGGLGLRSRLITWFDRQGRRLETVPDSGALSPVLAPDGVRVALHRSVGGNVDVWLLDADRKVFTRFTTDPGDDVVPIWSPDGTRVVFSSNRSRRPGSTDLYVNSAAGAAGQEQLLFAGDDFTGGTLSPSDWSPDGRWILFRAPGPNSGVWALPLEGEKKAFPVVEGPFDAAHAQFSPDDGKWIAFQSNESGRFEIYIQPFPTGGKLPVSSAGGAQPRWSRDGKELFYVAPDSRLMAVPIQLAPNVEAVKIGVPVPLFETPLAFVEERQQYVVSRDGQQFLMMAVVDREEVASPITVILNWKGKP